MKVKHVILILALALAAALSWPAGAQGIAAGEDLEQAMKWSEKQETRMVNAWGRWTDALKAFDPGESFFLEWDTPMSDATAQDYIDAGRVYREHAALFQKKFLKLKYRMAHPKGPLSGRSWLPLVRWVWRDHDKWTWNKIAQIIQRESNGQPNCITGSFYGLMQIYHGPLDPIQNIKTAHRWFHDDIRQGGTGWGPWAATAY